MPGISRPTKLLLFFCCLLLINFTVAQEHFIRGRLLDFNTDEPIPFATIRIKNKAVGVISNLEGDFKIPQKFKDVGDTLLVSCMGYERKEFRIDRLSLRHINMIRLGPSLIELDEAVVRGKRRKALTARQIVRRAIKNIPQNYPNEPFATVGYYRDYQLEDGAYINLNEAILEVFDSGFTTPDFEESKIRIYETKKNLDFKRDSIPQQPYNYVNWRKVIDKAYVPHYGGNEFTLLSVHNAIRNYQINTYSFVNRLDRDFLKGHSFSKSPDVRLGTDSFHRILVRKQLSHLNIFGTIYIDKGTYAIHKMEYAVYDRLKEAKEGRKNKFGPDSPLIFEVTTEYLEQDHKMFLNYISFNNHFRVQEPPKFVMYLAVMDWANQRFQFLFNKIPDESTIHDWDNYDIRYRGKKIKIKSTILIDDVVQVYPEPDNNRVKKMFREIETMSRNKEIDSTLMTFKVDNIKDLSGNIVNEWKHRNLNQFREFFVQRVKTDISIPTDTLFMIKNQPLFGNQPILPPANFKDYWMNTPLQTTDQ